MTLKQALEIIDENKHLQNTAPLKNTIDYLYPTPSDGKNHSEIVGALIMGNSIQPYLFGSNNFTVNVLYTDYEHQGVVFFESLDELLEKLN